MTNKLYSAVLAGTAVLALGLGTTTANAATQSGTATANIVSAITIQQTAGLNFGTIVPAAAAANVSVDSAGVRTCAASLTCSGTPAAGAFTATGTPSQGVTITTDASTTISSGGNNMSVTAIAPSTGTATLSAGGTASFTVGGTLNVNANQAAGVYSGNYNVNVNYQ